VKGKEVDHHLLGKGILRTRKDGFPDRIARLRVEIGRKFIRKYDERVRLGYFRSSRGVVGKENMSP